MTDQTIQLPATGTTTITGKLPLGASRRGFPFQVATTLAARFVMAVNSVITGILVARWLGAGKLGALAALNVTVAYAVQISSFGLASANTYFIAQDRRRLGSAATNSLLFGICAGAGTALLVVLLSKASPRLFEEIPLSLLVIAAAAVPFQLISLMGLNIFLAVGRVQTSNALDLVGQSLLLGNAVIALLILRRGLATLITLNAAGAMIVSLLVLVLVVNYITRRKDVAIWRPNWELFRRMMRYGLKVHVQTIAGLLLFRVDLLLVKYFRGSAEAGIYSVASQVALLLMLLPAVISTLLFPRIAAEKDERGSFACVVTRHATFLMFVICAAAVPAIFALPLLYGAVFSDAVVQTFILLPGVFLVSIGGVLSQHFSGTGLPLPLPLFWVVTLIFNVAANLLVVPVWGARGAAITSSISYALVFGLISIYFRVRTGNQLRHAYLIRGDELRRLLGKRYFFLRS